MTLQVRHARTLTPWLWTWRQLSAMPGDAKISGSRVELYQVMERGTWPGEWSGRSKGTGLQASVVILSPRLDQCDGIRIIAREIYLRHVYVGELPQSRMTREWETAGSPDTLVPGA